MFSRFIAFMVAAAVEFFVYTFLRSFWGPAPVALLA